MQEDKVVVWGGFTNGWENKRSEKQRRKGKTYPSKCRLQENSKERLKKKKPKILFLWEQCKEIEENNRMGKTRDLKKIEDSMGTFLAKMGTIKDRNGKDLTEGEKIEKRWQEYTEQLYRKGLNDLDNHNGAVIHLEPDIQSMKSSGP